MALIFAATAAFGQHGVGSPIITDAGGTRLSKERPAAQLGQRPMARQDPTLRVGRDLRQGEALVAMPRPPPQAEDPSDPRVRAKILFDEDALRVKRQAATMD